MFSSSLFSLLLLALCLPLTSPQQRVVRRLSPIILPPLPEVKLDESTRIGQAIDQILALEVRRGCFGVHRESSFRREGGGGGGFVSRERE